MKFHRLLSELQRRNVFKSTVAYLAVAWVIIQIASILLPAFDAPDYAMKVLVAVMGIGLVLWIVFSWIYDLTPQGIQKTGELETDETVHANNSRRLNRVIFGALTLAILLLIGASFWAGAQWSNPADPNNERRIAVLPFEIIGDKDEMDYFNEGMTESLIDEFSKMGQVTVLSIASSRYLEAGLNPGKGLVSDELEDIEYFIYGSFRKNENFVELQLKISETIDGKPKWTKKYESDVSEIRALSAQIVTEISRELGIGLKTVDKLRLAGIKPVKPETYELYLKGKYFLNKSTLEEWQRGIVYLQEAIDQNAADPYAYAGLAEGYITLGHNLLPPDDVFPKALAAAKRAIQLDSTNAEGWAALAHYHTYYGWDWDLAEYAFKKADQIHPNMAYNHYHRAWYLALFGRLDEAISAHKRAQEIDPFSPMHTAWLGYLYLMAGEYEKGLEEAARASEMHHDFALSMFVKGNIYIEMGREKEGLEVLEKAGKINYGWRYMGLVRALFKTGYKQEGMEIIKEMEAREQNSFISLCLAYAYFEAGNHDKGFENLQNAKGHAFYAWIRVLVTDEKIRQDPRYIELLDELGLPDPAPLSYNGAT